ncbi:MFS transporter [Amycolatopsis roodepoortensis]|uniref:MFS family arabinose efflux permease n=1 Tax=Amycolatopsis roodepoortensis TaxID=700274 RepID=A0ABR9LHR7_9PSEU|nr:MFS transporter [Amycolatopsis roodepoortensis]MBE1579820.1 putative MFS family arabinose efflux permease [Amycolatopsis roodepoortensis]
MATRTENAHSTLKGWAGVAAITASLFVFLTTELMPVGLLTPVSSSLDISVGAAGLMVTLYGVSAGLGVPFVVAWTRRINRRVLLSTLLAILTAGNLITALAPGYPLVLATRLVMGFANGAFWAIGVGMAMRIVPGRHANRAAAVVMSGISVATVLGMPLGTVLERLVGWQSTFLIWSGLSVLVFLAVLVLVPSLPSANAVSVREVFGLPRVNARLRSVLITVVLFVLGHFGVYTFIRPFLEGTSSASPAFVTVCLIVFGAGGAVGNFVAGHFVAKNVLVSFAVGAAGLVTSLLLLLVVGHGQVGALVALVLWGLSYGVVQLSQLTMTQRSAPDTFEAAMSLNTLAYNTSIALGALFAGLLADHAGITSVVWFGVVLTAASLLFMVGTRRT